MPSINSMYNPTTHLLEEQDDTIPFGIEITQDNNHVTQDNNHVTQDNNHVTQDNNHVTQDNNPITHSQEKQLQNFENEDDEVCNSCAELCINIACYAIISLMGIVAIGLIVISFF
jgi:hypothetical protein